MEVKGKVIAVLPEQTGTSRAGKTWRKRDFVIETEEQYPKKICIGLFGDKVEKCPNVGANVAVGIDIESREYNGKWFTQINAWTVKAEGGTTTYTPAPVPTSVTPAQAPAPPAAGNDDLPF